MPDSKSPASGALSRRVVIGVASASPLTLSQERLVSSNQTEKLCRAWLANEEEARRLVGLWGNLETYLATHHNWYELSEEEQRILPEAAEMHAIDARLDVIQNERETFLSRLPAMPAEDRPTLMLKFRTVQTLLLPEEHPEARASFDSALRDLVLLWR